MKNNPTTNDPSDQAYRRYLEALIAGDRQRCRAEFEAWLNSGIELRQLYADLIQRSLYEVGTLWESGKVSVATEHLATAITESLLTLVYPRLFSQPRVHRSAIVCCAANEYHQLGGKMVADIFELNGWRGYFLGANTPTRDLLELIREKKPDVVVLSVTIYHGMEALLHTATEIRKQFPAVPILVGGQAFRWGGQEQAEKIPSVHYIPSLDKLEAWMQTDANLSRP